MHTLNVADDYGFSMDLNSSYCCFDEVDYSEQQAEAINRIKGLTGRGIVISIDDVRKQFSQLHTRKAQGPDEIGCKVRRASLIRWHSHFRSCFSTQWAQD